MVALDMEISGRVWLASAFVFLVSNLAIALFCRSVAFPESIPVVGIRKQVFKSARASFRQLTDGIAVLSSGYRQVSSTQHSLREAFKLTNATASIHDAAAHFSSTSRVSKKR